MKFIRFFLYAFGCLVVLAAVAIALAFNSSVQTWLVGRALASRPQLALTIGKVDAGLGSVRVENLRLDQPGLVLAVPTLEVDTSLPDVAHGRVNVKRLVAKGWTLDLSHPTPAVATASTSAAPAASPSAQNSMPSPAPAASSSPKASTSEATRAAFQGILKQLRLPVDASLEDIDLEGTIVLPDNRGSARVTLTGGGLAAGREGKITCEATAIPPGQTTPASALVLRSDFTVHMNTPRTFDRVTVATGATVPGGDSKLQIVLGVTRTDDGGENYSAVFQAGQKQLAHLAAALPSGDAPLNGTWSIKLTDTDIAPYLIVRPLPTFAAAGQGTFTTDRDFSQIHASGNLRATLGQLARLSDKFSAINAAVLDTRFDVTRQGETLRIGQFNVQLSGDAPIVTVTTRPALRLNLLTHAIAAENPSSDLFEINIQNLPLAWLRPFTGDLVVTGGDLNGRLTGAANEGSFTLRSPAPLTIADLSVAQGGRPLLKNLAAKVDASGTYGPRGWTAELSAQLGSLLKVDAAAIQGTGTSQPIDIQGAFAADIHALLAQPLAAASGVTLSHGVAQGKFSVILADSPKATLTLRLKNLASATYVPLPSVEAQLTADRDASGLLNITAPVVITTAAGRKSDASLVASVQPENTGAIINAQLASESVFVEDLKFFALLTERPVPPPVSAGTPATAQTTASSSAATAPVPAATTQANSVPSNSVATAPVTSGTPLTPPWAAVTGNLKFAFKKIVCSPIFVVSDLSGSATVTGDAVKLDALQASLGDDSLLRATGALGFDSMQKSAPYGLTADVALNNFNPAAMLLAMNPDKPVPVDGKFDLASHLAGRAAELPQLADTAMGDVNVTSRGGTLRILSVKASRTADRVSTASAVLGIFGALTGNSMAQQYAGRGQAAADVMQQLNAINYTSLSVVISRDRQRSVNVKSIDLVSPQIHLTGSGQVTYTEGVPFRQWPLEIDLQLGARDQMAQDLQTLRLIGDAGADGLGYVPLAEPITLTGTLQSISAAQLQDLINRAIAN